LVALELTGHIYQKVIYQKVNRGGGAKPGSDGVPLSKSGRPDAMPPSFMKSCATPDAPGGPAMTVVNRPPSAN
jgi:hypothetical protein